MKEYLDKKILDRIKFFKKGNFTLSVKNVKVQLKDDGKREAKTRIYFFPEDESIIENFIYGRWNRDYRAYRKLLPEVFQKINRKQMEVKWSQYAGCSCGCSPGFIVKGMKDIDVFVEVKINKREK